MTGVLCAFIYYGMIKHIGGRDYYINSDGKEITLSELKNGDEYRLTHDPSVNWTGVSLAGFQILLVLVVSFMPAKELFKRIRVWPNESVK